MFFFRKQEERLAQRRREVAAMDDEISELMWMIALAKRQRMALDEEVLNKKCEMKFLRKEGKGNFIGVDGEWGAFFGNYW